MYTEDELLPISALQHLMFCPRQCALIHLEQAWSENAATAGGQILHDKVHCAEEEFCGDVLVVRSLRLRSQELGLVGMADVVEFHNLPKDQPGGISLSKRPGLWLPYPVEYKRGRKKRNDCDNVQLCAQAMCLEEMLRCKIPQGAIFYGKVRRRSVVDLDDRLRNLTRQTAAKLHQMIITGLTPPSSYSAKCENCSLIGQCMPKQTDQGNVAEYIKRMRLASMKDYTGTNHEKTC